MTISLVNTIDAHLDDALLQATLRASPIPMFIKDRAGVYKACNDHFCAFIGRDAEDIIGKTADDIAPPHLAKIYKAADQSLYAGGNPQIYRTEVQGAQGLRIVDFSKEIIRGKGDEIIGLVGAIHDLTDLISSYRKFKHSEALWQEGQTIAKLSNWCLDHNSGRVDTGLNGLTAAGLDIESTQIPLRVFVSLFDADDQIALDNTVNTTTIDEPRFQLRLQSTQPDGTIHYYQVVAETSFGASGEALLTTGIIQDVTDQVRSIAALDRAMRQTIVAMAGTMETRDPYTGGHQTRVAELCKLIGQRLGLSEVRLDGLTLAATVHDIGKIKLPAELLSKPSSLSDIEYELIKTHAEAGYNILKGIEFPWPIAEVVLQHHERMDGSGYPQGLKGEDIMLEARILAVADTLESICSHRPYRPALGIDAALAALRDGRSHSFDHMVVDAAIAIIENKEWTGEGT